MTGQERDYEAILSRVLHTTADQFEPVGDGLTKIRERLSEPWLLRQWWLLRSQLMVLRWFVVVRCESLLSKLRSRSDVPDLASDAAAGPEPDGAPLRSLLSISTVIPGKHQQQPVHRAMAWFRPALAVAGAVVLVVAGVFALGSIRTVVGLDSGTGSSSSNPSTGTGNGSPQGSGSQLRGSGSASPGSARTPSSSSGASASPGGPNKAVPPVETSASPSPSPASSSPSPSPTSASPSPTSASPSPTQTSPSPSPSSSTSQAPLTGPSTSPS